MQFENSILYQDILDDAIATCQERAIEMELGQDSCAAVAAVAHSGECPGELEWCEVEETNDEVGFELDMMP